MILYHGSQEIIKVPEFGKGKPTNDYGRGFYCTAYIDLAKEWACNEQRGGFANIAFMGYEEAAKEIYYPLRRSRDLVARSEYLSDKKGDSFTRDDLFMIDIMRNEIKSNDARLQRTLSI